VLYNYFFVSLPPKTIKIGIMKNQLTIFAFVGLCMLTGCKEKKQTQDIIAPRIEAPKNQAPIRMQPYNDVRSVAWLGKEYKVEVTRTPNDSLPMVKDETGQQFVDNIIKLRVLRADGSVAISKVFTKDMFVQYIDANYRKAGILEGLVFDEVDGSELEFAASVSLPQTDEYIPLEVKINNYGNVRIERDSQMDTNGDDGTGTNRAGNGDEDDEV